MVERPRYRAVIFDRDGVLTYFDLPALEAFFRPVVPLTIGEIGARWQRHCAAHTAPGTLADEASFWALFWHGVADELALDESARATLATFDYTRMLRAHDDARPALERARAAGMRTGVLSNFPLASLERSLAATGLLDLVDVCCSAAVIGVSKPDVRAYRATAERLGVRPDQCLFLDDEAPCVAGALEAEMDAYLVDRSRTSGSRRAVPDLEAVCALGPTTR